MGQLRINSIFHDPSFVMGNSVCSVLDCSGVCSVHNGAGSRTSAEQKFNHGQLQLRVNTCIPLHSRQRDSLGTAGRKWSC